MEYKIREIRPGEAANLKKLACSNFSVVEQIFMSKPKQGLVAETSEGTIAGGAFLIVTEAGRQKVGCIDIIFVLPEYRGSGVAKLLYHAAVMALHRLGCDTVMALVRGDNSQSLCRFQAEGLHPTTLHCLRQRIGIGTAAALFIKTAALACVTGCWILCEQAAPDSIGGTGRNLLRVFFTNVMMLLGGALLSTLRHRGSAPWWNLLAALFLLCAITLGETIGRCTARGTWRFVMPEGGLAPSAIVALMGGFYPMLGHWYLAKRQNTDTYRKKTAAPAKGAWLLLLAAVTICGVLQKTHPFFSNAVDLGAMLLLLYMLPFYPFDTFGGRRVREHNVYSYAALVTVTIIILSFVVCGPQMSIFTSAGNGAMIALVK